MIASSPKEYSEILGYLYRNPDKVKEMGKNAKRYALSNFEINQIIKEFDNVYNELLCKPKVSRNLLNRKLPDKKYGGCNYFVASQGYYAKDYIISASSMNIDSLFEADGKIAVLGTNMLSRTKGSLIHYLSYFNDDPYLCFWSGLLLQKKGEHREAIKYFNKAVLHGFVHPRVYWYILYSNFILGNDEDYGALSGHLSDGILEAVCRFPNGFEKNNVSKILEVINGVCSKEC
jgi:tetratricopeptide (TPR) repeat protein